MLGLTLNKVAMCLPFSVFTPSVLFFFFFNSFYSCSSVLTLAESDVLTVRNKLYALLYTRGGVSAEKTIQAKDLYSTDLFT